jgi:L-seryl-tRNA(Ser) seleniumtransferase
MPPFRLIPSLDSVMSQPAAAALAAQYGRDQVVAAARRAADALRAAIGCGTAAPETAEAASAWIVARMHTDLDTNLSPSLRRVINATGVIIHTNLGRAPLAREALDRAEHIGGGYSNLEYDLATGDRGRRDVHAERLLARLTGAPAGLVVNNNAAATLVVLAALAAGREVIVSRGELVEIGGGFRVPDVMAQSGAILREVGTTNRTRVADYAAAIGPKTALILRVHPSNFRIEGFTERPPLTALAGLARRFDLPLFEDLGSGWLDASMADVPALRDEPTVSASLRDGASLVAFSGDKLLGGPQAGLVVGARDLVERVRRHPLMRAVRADKLTYAAMEATLGLWLRPQSRPGVPVYRMLTMSADEIRDRARRLIDGIGPVPGLRCVIREGASTTGGGSAPASALPTWLVAIDGGGHSAADLERRLRANDPPVIARIVDDTVVIDLRTVAEDDDQVVAAAITRATLDQEPSP